MTFAPAPDVAVGADLVSAVRATYVLDQRVAYTYARGAANLHQRLLVLPPWQRAGQILLDQRFAVESTHAADVRRRSDRFGNTVLHVRAADVGSSIEFLVEAVIERDARPAPAGLDGWRPRLRSATELTRPDDALRAEARRLARVATGPDLVRAIGHRVHAAIAYAKGATDVSTTAADSWRLGAGVCQDMAHVMLALCRQQGMAARYVSGHLVGEGPSHAWVEVLVESAGRTEVVAFDPTHDRVTDLRYVTVAVGRDYADVAPTSGSCWASVRGVLTIDKSLRVVAAA